MTSLEKAFSDHWREQLFSILAHCPNCGSARGTDENGEACDCVEEVIEALHRLKGLDK